MSLTMMVEDAQCASTQCLAQMFEALSVDVVT
jgi:hypothetical protein